MLSHGNLLEMGRSINVVDPIGMEGRCVSFLPRSWIGEQMIAVACGLQMGFTLSFAEEAATQRADLRELGPNVMFSPPRIWEDMLSSIMVRVGEAGWAKRKTFAWGQAVGDRYAEKKLKGEKIGLGLRLQHRLADWMARPPVRGQLGLTRIDPDHRVAAGAARAVMGTPAGPGFRPAFTKNKLKSAPDAEAAVVFGQDGSPDPPAIPTAEPSTVGAWAEHRRLGYTTYTDLV